MSAEIPTKQDVRTRVSALRRAALPLDRALAGTAISRAVVDLVEHLGARTVAAYVSIGTEPTTPELLEILRSRGVRVLLPVLREDLDLDWAEYVDPATLVRGARGLSAPAGPRLGLDAVAGADLVVVPALAVDERGMRLGRGGGSYDRALTRVPPGRPVVALLYDGEVLPAVPVDAHDRAVTLAVTPSGVRRFA